MDAHDTEMITPCPACKRDVALRELKCPNCGAPADSSSPFVAFRRPDGSKGMLDQLTAQYIRSNKDAPSQKDLDQILHRSNRVELHELVFENQTGTLQMRHSIAEPKDIADLGKSLQTDNSGAHLMSIPDFRLKFFDATTLLGEIDLGFPMIIRWPAKWKNDGALLAPETLADFFASRGFPKLRQILNSNREHDRKREAAHQAWLETWERAMLPGFGTILAKGAPMYAIPPALRSEAAALLRQTYPDTEHQVLALLAWYGHGTGPWSGFRAEEGWPELLLRDYAADDIARSLERGPLNSQHLEGAARLVALWVPKDRRNKQRELVERMRRSPVFQQLAAHVRATGSSDKQTRFQNFTA